MARNSRNYRSRRNNRGTGAGSNPPPPPLNSNPTGGVNMPPPVNTSPLAQTIWTYLQGVDIMAKVYKLYFGLFIGIILLFASQFAAGALAFNHGLGTMAMFELTMALIILFVWFLPHILITGGVVSTVAAINSPNLLTDQAIIKFAVFWVKGFLSVCAYTIGIVFTVLLLFNIKNDYNGLAILIVVGTFIGIFTVVIGDAGTLTPKLMRAGLVGFVVMILLTYLPGVDGESAVRDFLVTHNVLAGIATFVVIVVGTSNLGTFKDWSWGKLAWLLSVRNLFKLIGLALFLFLIWWFFNIKAGNEIVTAKFNEIHPATTRAPDVSNNQPAPSTSQSAQETIRSSQKAEEIISDPNAIVVKITKTKIGPEKYCPKNLPSGTYVFAVRDTSFYISNEDGSGRALIDTVVEGRRVPDVSNFPYKKNNYSYGLLIEDQPNLAVVTIENGCFSAQFNTFPEAKNFKMDSTKIMISFLLKGK